MYFFYCSLGINVLSDFKLYIQSSLSFQEIEPIANTFNSEFVSPFVMLSSFVIVAVISITVHNSVFFHYLMSISLSTSLLTMCPLLIISSPPKPLISNIVLMQLHKTTKQNKQHSIILYQTAFCTGFQPNFQAVLEKTESTFKILQELSQPLFTANRDKFCL